MKTFQRFLVLFVLSFLTGPASFGKQTKTPDQRVDSVDCYEENFCVVYLSTKESKDAKTKAVIFTKDDFDNFLNLRESDPNFSNLEKGYTTWVNFGLLLDYTPPGNRKKPQSDEDKVKILRENAIHKAYDKPIGLINGKYSVGRQQNYLFYYPKSDVDERLFQNTRPLSVLAEFPHMMCTYDGVFDGYIVDGTFKEDSRMHFSLNTKLIVQELDSVELVRPSLAFNSFYFNEGVDSSWYSVSIDLVSGSFYNRLNYTPDQIEIEKGYKEFYKFPNIFSDRFIGRSDFYLHKGDLARAREELDNFGKAFRLRARFMISWLDDHRGGTRTLNCTVFKEQTVSDEGMQEEEE